MIKITAMTLLLVISGVANAQNWSLTGNSATSTLKLGGNDPGQNVHFVTEGKTRMTLTAYGQLGIGTTRPNGWQEIVYTPLSYKGNNGLVVTLFGGLNGIGTLFDVLKPDFIGSGLLEVSYGSENVPNTSTSAFTVPFDFRTGHITSPAIPLYYKNTKPMFWLREKNFSGRYRLTGKEEFDTKFIVMPDGSCGINIANPRAALDVRGSQAPNRPAAIFGSRARGTSISYTSSGLVQYYTQMVQLVPVLKENGYNQIVKKDDQGMFFTNGLGAEGSNSGGAFVLAPWAEGGKSDVGGMRMDAHGNTEFHGTLRATKMNVDAKWWSDFVFADDYKLPSLAEVEAFIKTNKHLPNVPSEAEVLENGIDVANMQAIQQQKIEELTLYIIQQQKQIELLMQLVSGGSK